MLSFDVGWPRYESKLAGRYERLNYNDRTCFNCIDKIKNVQHVLLDSPVYQSLRESLFAKLCIEFLNIMTSTDDKKNVCNPHLPKFSMHSLLCQNLPAEYLKNETQYSV